MQWFSTFCRITLYIGTGLQNLLFLLISRISTMLYIGYMVAFAVALIFPNCLESSSWSASCTGNTKNSTKVRTRRNARFQGHSSLAEKQVLPLLELSCDKTLYSLLFHVYLLTVNKNNNDSSVISSTSVLRSFISSF